MLCSYTQNTLCLYAKIPRLNAKSNGKNTTNREFCKFKFMNY